MATVLELRNEAREALTKASAAIKEGKQEEYDGFWKEYTEKLKASESLEQSEAAEKALTEKHEVNSEIRREDDAFLKTTPADQAKGGVQLADGSVVPFADESTEGWIKGYPASVQHTKIVRSLTPDLRAAANQENQAFAKWFRHGMDALAGDERKAMGRLRDTEEKTLTEGTGSAGGFLVPTDQRNELIIKDGVLGGVMRPVSSTFQTTRDSGTFPASTDATTWATVAEEAAFAESNPTLSEVSFTIRKVGRLNKVSSELLEDSAVDVASLLNLLLGRSLGRYEDQQGIEGDGTTEPLGLRVAGSAGTITPAVMPTAIATAPTALDIFSWFFALPAQFRDSATWFMTSSMVQKIMGIGSIVAGIHAVELLSASPVNTMLGRPIILFDGTGWDDAAAIAANEVFGAFGDLSTYYFVDRVGLSVTRLDERFADTDQVGFRFRVRYDSLFSKIDGIRLLKAAAA